MSILRTAGCISLLCLMLVLRKASAAFSRAAGTLSGIGHHSRELSRLQMSSSTSDLHILALHGSGGTGAEFSANLDPLWNKIESLTERKVQVLAPDAPFRKEGSEGYCWWTMEPGERSFNAQKYHGFDKSQQLVLDTMGQHEYDIIVAHSQGAILVTALLAQGEFASIAPRILLNGVAWPNPHSQQLQSLECSSNNGNTPRIFLSMGKADRINPMESAQQVLQAFQSGGANMTPFTHTGGHGVPIDDETALQAMVEFCIDSNKEKEG